MEQLYYYDAPHKYYGVDSGIEYTPVSTIAHKFEAYTPWELIKPRSAAKLGVTVKELEKIWDKKKIWGTTVGTLLHQGKEDLVLEYGYDFEGKHYEPLKYKMDGDKKYQLLDLPMMGQWVIPELITGINIRDKVHIAGTSDLPLIDDGVLHILDYKTDKTIDYTSKYNKYMNPPLQWLSDCNYYMYSLKMSMYMFFILQQYPFLTPGKIFIIHEVMVRDKEDLAIVENGIPKVLKEEWHEINYKKMEKHVRNVLNYLYLQKLK